MDYKAFTITAHGSQKYGNDPYLVHLQAVQDKAREFTDNEEILACAFMHDILEDTNATEAEVIALVGPNAYLVIQCLTDKPGKNRRERHLNTYWILRQNVTALFVKLCDRWCNQQNVIDTNNSKLIQMYRKEYMEFKFALYGNMHEGTQVNQWIQILWGQLDAQYQSMQEIL